MPIAVLLGTDNSLHISQYNKACQKVVLHNLSTITNDGAAVGNELTLGAVCVVSFSCVGSKALVT
jgi:hypothetical protein